MKKYFFFLIKTKFFGPFINKKIKPPANPKFLRKAIAGGRVPQEISNQYFQDQFGFEAPKEEPIFRMPTSSKKIIKEQNTKTQDSVFKHKGSQNK